MQFARFLGLGATSRTTHGQHLFLSELPGFHREIMKHPELGKWSILIIFQHISDAAVSLGSARQVLRLMSKSEHFY